MADLLNIMVVILWLLDLQLPMQSVPITREVVSLNPAQAGCTNFIQYYVIKFVSDLRQVVGFLRFHLLLKLTAKI